jgi:hypothetical protein
MSGVLWQMFACAEIAASGELPLDYMLRVMRDKAAERSDLAQLLSIKMGRGPMDTVPPWIGEAESVMRSRRRTNEPET